jgi:hypothetical protein
MASTKTSGDLVVPNKYGILCDESAKDLYVLDIMTLRVGHGGKLSGSQKDATFLVTIWNCSRQP